MVIKEGTVQRMSIGQEHIFYEYNALLNGIYIIHLYFHNAFKGWHLWKHFLHNHEGPIYFGTDDPSYIGNHCKFHGNYGGKKVYQYVR